MLVNRFLKITNHNIVTNKIEKYILMITFSTIFSCTDVKIVCMNLMNYEIIKKNEFLNYAHSGLYLFICVDWYNF